MRKWLSAGSLIGLTVVLTTAWAIMIPAPASATHFRYGHYSWRDVPGNTVEFTVQNAFRRSGYTCVDPTTLGSKPCTDPDGRPGVGDVIQEYIGNTHLNTGDGTAIGSPLGPLLYKVTSIDPGQNWLFALALDPARLPAIDATIRHTYAAPGNYAAFTQSCCRISDLLAPNAHINNPDGSYRVDTRVNAATGNNPPVSALPPIVACPIDDVCSFDISAADPDGDTLKYRLSTPAEASGSSSGFVQPGPPHAPHAASISQSGTYRWDTTGATVGPSAYNTLYSTQVSIQDLNSTGAVKSDSALDFFIQLVPCPATGCRPPEFQAPTCDSTRDVNVGETVGLNVHATDPNPVQTVTLDVANRPLGSSLSPQLPVQGNPVSTTFTWTPTQAALGTSVITFSARSPDGSTLCSVTLNVVERPKLALSPATATHAVATRHTVTANLKNPAGSNSGQIILFAVTGANSRAGSATTDDDGNARFTYTGNAVGNDQITACFDDNRNRACDPGEATATATKTWKAPPEGPPWQGWVTSWASGCSARVQEPYLDAIQRVTAYTEVFCPNQTQLSLRSRLRSDYEFQDLTVAQIGCVGKSACVVSEPKGYQYFRLTCPRSSNRRSNQSYYSSLVFYPGTRSDVATTVQSSHKSLSPFCAY